MPYQEYSVDFPIFVPFQSSSFQLSCFHGLPVFSPPHSRLPVFNLLIPACFQFSLFLPACFQFFSSCLPVFNLSRRSVLVPASIDNGRPFVQVWTPANARQKLFYCLFCPGSQPIPKLVENGRKSQLKTRSRSKKSSNSKISNCNAIFVAKNQLISKMSTQNSF